MKVVERVFEHRVRQQEGRALGL